MQQDSIKVKGEVDITILYNDGTTEKRHYDNLVVTNGKTILAKRLAGDVAYASDQISKIAFGTNGTAAVVGNATLGAEVLSKAVTVSYPAANSVMFSATMLDSEGGTSTYQELGLKSHTNNILFSRLVISPITKSNLYKIQVDWTISFQ